MGIVLTGEAPPYAPGVEKTTTVVYYNDPVAFGVGSQHLIQANIPVEGKLPILYHPDTGQKCDLIPVTRTVYGNPDLYQVVVRHTVTDPNQNTITLTTEPTVEKVDTGPQFATVNMDNLTVAIATTAGVTFRGRLGDGILKKVWRTGNWVDEREIWVRSTGASGQKGPGIRFFIDRRADQTIKVQFIIENSCVVPTLSSLSNQDPESTGPIFYSQINFENIPSTWFVVQDEVEFPWSTTSSNLIIKPENVLGGSGPEQMFPLGGEWGFGYTFRSSLSNTVKAKAIGSFVGYGYPKSGDYNVFTGRGYSAGRSFGLDISDSRIDYEVSAGTGLQATIGRDDAHLSYVKGLIATGSPEGAGQNSPFFAQSRVGSYFPWGPTNLRDAGEAGVDLWGTGGLHGSGFRVSFLRLRLTMQRHYSGIVHGNTGDLISNEDLVAIKGIGLNPWQRTLRGGEVGSERWIGEAPCFIRKGYTTSAEFSAHAGGDEPAARAIGQDTHPWCQPATIGTANTINPDVRKIHTTEWADGGTYPPFAPNKAEANHHARYFGAVEPLAYGANMGFAKFLAIREGVYFQHCYSRRAVDPAFSAMNPVYFKAISSMQESINVITSNGKLNWAGFKEANRSSTSQNRGNGMLDHCVASAYRFSDPGSKYRTETDEWISKAVETFEKVATTYGATLRNDAFDSDANQPTATGFSIQLYPASDKLGVTDMSNRQGAFPLDNLIRTLPLQEGITYETGQGFNTSHVQTFQIGYRHFGMTDIALACIEPNTDLWNRIRNLTQKFTTYMFNYARRSGQPAPPSMVLITEGAGGVSDAPGTGQGPWPGGEVRPGEWYFDRNTIIANGVIFTTDWNFRCLITICNEMLMAFDSSDLVSVGQLYQFIKDFFGVPSGNVDSVVNLAFSQYNGESNVQVYWNEYLRSQFGYVIGTLKGLKAKGVIV